MQRRRGERIVAGAGVVAAAAGGGSSLHGAMPPACARGLGLRAVLQLLQRAPLLLRVQWLPTWWRQCWRPPVLSRRCVLRCRHACANAATALLTTAASRQLRLSSRVALLLPVFGSPLGPGLVVAQLFAALPVSMPGAGALPLRVAHSPLLRASHVQLLLLRPCAPFPLPCADVGLQLVRALHVP